MRTILGPGRQHGVARVSIFLAAVALIAAMVSCGPPRYAVTIASTAGGTVTTPGEGLFSYDRETVVDLVATPDAGYHFAGWSGNVDTVADPYAAVTTITVDNRYSIVASFGR